MSEEIFKLEKDNLEGFLLYLSQKYNLFLPRRVDDQLSFGQMKPGGKPSLDHYFNTDLPPKEVFFPQRETLLSYEGGEVKHSTYKAKPIALFGVRPCDTKGIILLDRVFAEGEYEDPYWKARRTNSLLLTLGCNAPLSTCFCHWFNLGPFNKEGTDIFLTDIGDAYLVEPCSKKGEECLRGTSLLGATGDDRKVAEEIRRKAESSLSERVEISSLKGRLLALWEEDLWEDISQKCLSCAACSYLCPTCHCFDIQEEGSQEKGERIRIWDSCMFKLFTQEAAGTNPRPTPKERLRQRIMHKFSYFLDNLGEFGCVGCGRCIRGCPVNLDIREVIKAVKSFIVESR